MVLVNCTAAAGALHWLACAACLTPRSGALHRDADSAVRPPAVCYLISAYFASNSKANLAASLYFVFNMLFGGLLLTGRNAVISGIMYLSTFNFGFQVRCARGRP
jgi:hypothetical protein